MSEIIHKREYGSGRNDPVKLPLRTTACGKTFEYNVVAYWWKFVTCEECLKMQGRSNYAKTVQRNYHARKQASEIGEISQCD